jgi:hypothetical protein
LNPELRNCYNAYISPNIEDNVLDFDNSLGKLIDLLIPFEKDAVSVSKVKNTREGG